MSTSDSNTSLDSGWFDSHCHLSHIPQSSKNWQQANQENIRSCLIPSTKQNEWEDIVSNKSHVIGVAIGTHPWYVDSPKLESDALEAQLDKYTVNAIGEIGLDFFISDRKPRPGKEIQLESFQRQLGIASNHKKPVVIHAVKAHQDVLSSLKSTDHCGGVIHAFVGSYEVAQRYVQAGFVLGIGPQLLKSTKLQQAVSRLPKDAIVLETDAPYMSLGKNENPLLDLIAVGQRVSELWEVDIAQVREQTTKNASSIFSMVSV